MPEEKTATNETYKRVYADWKPSTTLEKADVVGTIEAIQDAAQPRTVRDKSAWRKSTLNVPNSTEETTESARRLVRQRSRESVSSGSPLKSIIEEDRRKSIIQQLGERSASDRLQIYIRRPSDSPDSASEFKSPISPPQPIIDATNIPVTSDHHSIYIRPLNGQTSPAISSSTTETNISSKQAIPNVPQRVRRPTTSPPPADDITNNKIEIDSDNIETPPSIRRQLNAESVSTATTITTPTKLATTPNPCRKLQTPRPLHKKTIEENNARIKDTDQRDNDVDPEILGDGQFDRHSSARRTRRYKRPTDYSSGAEDRNMGSPDLSAENKQMLDNDLDNITFPKVEDKDARLKRWQERLACLDKDDLKQTTIKTRVGKVGRNISSINQEDVREAIRNLKSPTETPERVWSPPREIIKERNIPTKASQYELNDEGFEETQSLVSDTPSHGKDSTSSCNEQADPAQKKSATTKTTSSTGSSITSSRIRPLRMTSSDSAGTTATGGGSSSESTKRKLAVPTSKANVLSLLERNRQSLERSRSLRITGSTGATSSVQQRSNMIPKRTNSLRKNDSSSSVTKRDVVERSGSRTSLRSSRSSLNSAVSTNTVKNVSQKSPRAMTLEKSIYKKPTVITSPPTASSPIRSRMPASRSSSSGSSISTSIRRSPASAKGLSVTNSFKENQSANTTTPTTKYIARTSSLRLSPSAAPNSISAINTTSAKIKARLSAQVAATNIPTQTTTSKIQSVSNFMRPTAASATKFSGAKGK